MAIALFAVYDGYSLFDQEFYTSETFIVVTSAGPQIFSWWSSAALFYSIVLFIRARERSQHLWDRSRCSTLLLALHTALFALVVILGTTAFIIYAVYEWNFYLGLINFDGLIQTYNNFENVLYSADAFLYITAADIAITAAVTYRSLRHRGCEDPVSTEAYHYGL